MRAQRSKDFRLKTFVSERVRRWCGCVYSDFGGDSQRRTTSRCGAAATTSGPASPLSQPLDWIHSDYIYGQVCPSDLCAAPASLCRASLSAFLNPRIAKTPQSSSARCRVMVRGNGTAFSQLNAKSGKRHRLPRPKAPTFGGSAFSRPSPGWCRAANSRVRAKEYFRPGLFCGDTVTRYGPRYARTARVSACPWT